MLCCVPNEPKTVQGMKNQEQPKLQKGKDHYMSLGQHQLLYVLVAINVSLCNESLVTEGVLCTAFWVRNMTQFKIGFLNYHLVVVSNIQTGMETENLTGTRD